MGIDATHGEETVAGPVADFIEAGGDLLGEAFVVGDLVHQLIRADIELFLT